MHAPTSLSLASPPDALTSFCGILSFIISFHERFVFTFSFLPLRYIPLRAQIILLASDFSLNLTKAKKPSSAFLFALKNKDTHDSPMPHECCKQWGHYHFQRKVVHKESNKVLPTNLHLALSELLHRTLPQAIFEFITLSMDSFHFLLHLVFQALALVFKGIMDLL